MSDYFVALMRATGLDVVGAAPPGARPAGPPDAPGAADGPARDGLPDGLHDGLHDGLPEVHEFRESRALREVHELHQVPDAPAPARHADARPLAEPARPAPSPIPTRPAPPVPSAQAGSAPAAPAVPAAPAPPVPPAAPVPPGVVHAAHDLVRTAMAWVAAGEANAGAAPPAARIERAPRASGPAPAGRGALDETPAVASHDLPDGSTPDAERGPVRAPPARVLAAPLVAIVEGPTRGAPGAVAAAATDGGRGGAVEERVEVSIGTISVRVEAPSTPFVARAGDERPPAPRPTRHVPDSRLRRRFLGPL